MTMSVDKYRRHAVDCLRIAEGVPDSQNRMLLIDMAQSWLLLAQEADKSLATDVVVETPLLPGEASRPIVMQQQQQTQPKKEE